MNDKNEKTQTLIWNNPDGTTSDLSGLTFDLGNWEWFESPEPERPDRLTFGVADGDGREYRIITNRYGEGKWVLDKDSCEYVQVAGTCQYRLPDTREELRDELVRGWARKFGAPVTFPEDERDEQAERRHREYLERLERIEAAQEKARHDRMMRAIADAWAEADESVECEVPGGGHVMVDRSALFHDFPISRYASYTFLKDGKTLKCAYASDMEEFQEKHPDMIPLGGREVAELMETHHADEETVLAADAEIAHYYSPGDGWSFDGGDTAYGDRYFAVDEYLRVHAEDTRMTRLRALWNDDAVSLSGLPYGSGRRIVWKPLERSEVLPSSPRNPLTAYDLYRFTTASGEQLECVEWIEMSRFEDWMAEHAR